MLGLPKSYSRPDDRVLVVEALPPRRRLDGRGTADNIGIKGGADTDKILLCNRLPYVFAGR